MTDTITKADTTANLYHINKLKDSKYKLEPPLPLALSELEALTRIIRGEWTRHMLAHCRGDIADYLYNVRCDVYRGLCKPDNVNLDVKTVDYEDDILDIRGILDGTRRARLEALERLEPRKELLDGI